MRDAVLGRREGESCFRGPWIDDVVVDLLQSLAILGISLRNGDDVGIVDVGESEELDAKDLVGIELP